MKKINFVLSLVLTAFVSLMLFGAKNVKADIDVASLVRTTEGGTDAVETDRGIEVKTGTAWNSFVDIGRDGNGNANFFTIADNNHVSIKFSMIMKNSQKEIKCTNSDSFISVQVMNGWNVVMSVRFQMGSAALDNGDHATCVAQGQWDNQVWIGWVDSKATEDGSFYVEFSKENLFESYKQGELAILDDENNSFFNANNSLVNNIDNIWFRISPDGGYQDNVEFILREVNGDSFVYEDDNKGSNYLSFENSTSAVTGSKAGYYGYTGTSWDSYVDVCRFDGANAGIFDLTDGKHASIKFKLVMNGSCTNTGDSFISVQVMNGWNTVMSIRFQMSSAALDNGDHSTCIAQGQWDNQVWVGWVDSKATDDGSFFVDVSKADLFSSTKQGTLTVLDDDNNSFHTANENILNDIDSIWFRISPDGGYQNAAKFILEEVNGVKVTGTKDTTGPVISGISKIASSLEAGSEYTVPVTASDLSGIDSIWIADLEGTKIDTDLKINVPNEAGEFKFVIHAKDNAGNESTEEITVAVQSNVTAPVLSNLPIFDEAIEANYYSSFEVAYPTVESSIDWTLKAIIKNANDEVILEASLADETIKFNVPLALEAGDYKIYYEATNEKGTTSSEGIDLTINLPVFTEADWFQCEEGIKTNVTDNGVVVYSDANGKTVFLGQYDLRYALQLKVLVSKEFNSYFEMLVVSSKDPSKYMLYRVWPQLSGHDNGDTTNVYGIELEGDYEAYAEQIAAHGTFIEFADCGWTVRQYDDVENQYFMGVDMIYGFQSEKSGGYGPVTCSSGTYKIFGGNWDVMATGLNVSDVMAEFFDVCDTNLFNVYVRAEHNSGSHVEYTLVELYGQSLAKNATKKDAVLKVGTIPTKVLVNEMTSFDVFGIDIFNQGAKVKMNVVKPDSSSEELEGTSFLPTAVGDYHITFSIESSNGHKVTSDEYVVSVRTIVTAPTIEVEAGSYNAQYAQNAEVTIADATLGGNYLENTYVITVVLPDNSTVTVTPGSKYVFTKVGTYKIQYKVSDDAEPVANTATKEIVINVPDTTNPVITAPESLDVKLGATFDLSTITVSDDSSVDVTFRLLDPNGDSATVSGVVAFDKAGQYKLTVKAVDAYDCETTVEVLINVTEDKKVSSGCGSVITSCLTAMIIVGSLAGLALRKRKEF